MEALSRPKTLRRGAPPIDPDLASHIKSRLQEYSKTIAALEKYKSLCEARILELAPGHPLPIVDTHLSGNAIHRSFSGKFCCESPQSCSKFQSLDSREVVREDLERLRRANSDLEQAKAEIESSLRSEVLHSEEQRAYIEALKQALESKLSALGLDNGAVKDYCTAALTHTQKHDSYITIAKLQGALISQEEKIQQLEARIAAGIQRRHIGYVQSEQAKNEQEETALQRATSDANKLEEEKNALLDYIAEQKKQEAQLQDLLETIEPELLGIKREHESLLERYETAMDDIRIRERAIEKLETEAKELTRELEHVETRNRDMEQELATKVRTMRANQTTLSESLQETQNELDAVKAANSELLKELTSAQESLERTNQQLEDSENCKSALSEQLLQLKSTLAAKETAESALAVSEKSLQETQQKLAKLGKSHEELLTELHTMTLASSNSSRLASQLQDELRGAKSELAQANGDLESTQEEKKTLVEKMETLVRENQSLLSQVATARQAEHSAKKESQQYRLEAEEVRNGLLGLMPALEMTVDGNSLDSFEATLETLTGVHRRVVEVRSESEAESERLKTEIAKLADLLERRETELTNSHRIIDELRAKSEHYSAVERLLSEIQSENAHFRDVDTEKTTKLAQSECRVSCLLRENEDLQAFVAIVFASIPFEDAASALERMIRTVSQLQQLYKDQYESECLSLTEDGLPGEKRLFGQQTEACRRNLVLLGEDFKAVLGEIKRKSRENAGQRVVETAFRTSDPRTLMDRLNLPKIRSETAKIRALDSL